MTLGNHFQRIIPLTTVYTLYILCLSEVKRMMYGTIQKWGNSQGIRLPKGALSIARLQENDDVEIIATEESITLRKARRHRNLDELFAGYQGDYMPVEFDTGADVGREVID